jgi:hypothetical protein
MRSHTGEATSAIIKRQDDANWPRVHAALSEGAILWKPVKISNYYIRRGNETGGGCLSMTRIRKLERDGVIELVGPFTYRLTPNPSAPTSPTGPTSDSAPPAVAASPESPAAAPSSEE